MSNNQQQQPFISIVYRGSIKVFYNSKKEAELDGCKDISNINDYGQINAFSGLRGDAKVILFISLYIYHLYLKLYI